MGELSLGLSGGVTVGLVLDADAAAVVAVVAVVVVGATVVMAAVATGWLVVGFFGGEEI